MNFSSELSKLVIRNMEIVEIAPEIVEEVEKKLFTAINKRIEESLGNKDNWTGIFELCQDGKDGGTTFQPSDWPKDEDNENVACYELDCIEPDDRDYYWLSCATGYRGCVLCLKFTVDAKAMRMATKKYKERLRDFCDQNASLLQNNNFLLAQDGRSIVCSFSFEANKIAEAFPDFDEALDPLDKALGALFNVHHKVNDFVVNIFK